MNMLCVHDILAHAWRVAGLKLMPPPPTMYLFVFLPNINERGELNMTLNTRFWRHMVCNVTVVTFRMTLLMND
jgi:hypothetical protein